MSSCKIREEKRCFHKEFREFYDQYRCKYSPQNADEVFELATKVYRELVEDRMSFQGFLAVLYDTLNGRPSEESEGGGLFRTFNHKLYNGHLPLERHFLNMFDTHLRGNLKKAAIYPRSDQGRRCKKEPKYRGRRRHFGRRKSLQERWLIEVLKRWATELPEPDRTIVRGVYYDDDALAGLHPQYVKRIHERAISRIQRELGIILEKSPDFCDGGG